MRKLLLYLTNSQLTASMWQRGRLFDGQSFQHNEAGWQALSNYLSGKKNTPAYLLMDLIEENFQRDTLPHVLGTARKSMIDRRLSQLYHDTPFRHAGHQGREKTGRKDDIVLFNALTNASLIRPWINVLLKQQVPIAGLYSAALLSALLLNKLRLGNEPILLITHQSSGLRQNFFQDGYLRFSRLVVLPSQDADDIAKSTLHEIAKTRLFLANSRLLQRGEPLKIVTVDNSGALQKMQNRIAETNTSQSVTAEFKATTYRFINHDEARDLSGLKYPPENNVSDTLFFFLFVDKLPASHYTLEEQHYSYKLWQSRIILYALSVATTAGCLLWTGANVVEALYADSQLNQLEQKTKENHRRYQDIVGSMPETAANPHDMKTVVELHDSIVHNMPTPKTLFDIVSQALERMPQIRLNELNWEINDGNNVGELEAVAPAQIVTSPSATQIGLPTKPAEIVVLKGQVMSFSSYRAAIGSINQFSRELRKNKHVKVSIIRLPLDIRSSVSLIGEAGNATGTETALFELRIMWKT